MGWGRGVGWGGLTEGSFYRPCCPCYKGGERLTTVFAVTSDLANPRCSLLRDGRMWTLGCRDGLI